MSQTKLFTPVKLGPLDLAQRIVMAPLTRFRADDNHVPTDMQREYYSQRASTPGTLIISEATFIAPQAGGYDNIPGIWSKEQISGWKKITDAVHAKGCHMWLQLWALGRAADVNILARDGYKVKSSGNIAFAGAFEGGTTPEPLTEAEIQEYIGLYAQAAKNGMEAGFDGVEIHGGNGYLVDQFWQDTANNRTDSWGGSIENRARFGVECIKAVAAAVGPERAAMRMSPFSDFQGMKMAEPVPQFSYIVQELRKLNLAYLHVVEARVSGVADIDSVEKVDFLVDIWNKPGPKPVLLAGGYTPASAKKAVDEEYKDKDVIIVFGRHYLANPDLIFRIKNGLELNKYDRSTFYTAKQAEGYTTYPFSQEFLAQKTSS